MDLVDVWPTVKLHTFFASFAKFNLSAPFGFEDLRRSNATIGVWVED